MTIEEVQGLRPIAGGAEDAEHRDVARLHGLLEEANATIRELQGSDGDGDGGAAADVDADGQKPGRHLRERLKAQNQEITALRQTIEQRDAADRLIATQQLLKDLGYRPELSRLVPADLELSEGSLEVWAEQNGITPGSRGPRLDPEAQQALANYARLVQGSFAPATPSALQTLREELHHGMKKVRDTKTKPTEADFKHAESLAERVNDLNRQREALIHAGKATGPEGGIAQFGGLHDAPIHANRTLDARS